MQIRVTCIRDGEVLVAHPDMRLVYCVDAPETGSWYSFRCPTCGAECRRPADLRIIQALIGYGVTAEQWAIGTDRTPTYRIDGQPVDEDDLITFGLRLHADHEPKHYREAA